MCEDVKAEDVREGGCEGVGWRRCEVEDVRMEDEGVRCEGGCVSHHTSSHPHPLTFVGACVASSSFCTSIILLAMTILRLASSSEMCSVSSTRRSRSLSISSAALRFPICACVSVCACVGCICECVCMCGMCVWMWGCICKCVCMCGMCVWDVCVDVGVHM